MLLRSADGDSFELTLLGYQFAEADDEWDRNWLQVQVVVHSERGNWRASDPALLTSDVARLADWLCDPAEQLEFMEPCLAFECVERDEGKARLRVWFELGLRPDWAAKDFVGERDLSVELTVSTDGLRAAAAQLRGELEAYPGRP